MPSPAAGGGTSLAPTPTHAHHLSREPSNQDLESAALLERLHNDLGPNRREVPQATQAEATSPAQNERSALPEGRPQPLDVTEYHALEDSLRYPQDHPPTQQPQTPGILHARQQVNNAPITGQICSNCGTNRTPLWRRSPEGQTICNACGLYYKARNQHRPTGLKRTATSPSSPSIPDSARSSQTQDTNMSPQAINSTVRQTYVAAEQMPPGTCPGGGRCNGTGGQAGCNGCPAYNNRVSKTAQFALAQVNAAGQVDTSPQPPSPNTPHGTVAQTASAIPACHNCRTTITPLWRRDDQGHTICNACGLYFKLHNRHRPFTMKKQEIKRRKRVMPAEQILHHQQPSDQHQGYFSETSASSGVQGPSPVVQGAQTEPQNQKHNDLPLHNGRKSFQEPEDRRPAERDYVPPPADFTTYRPNPPSHSAPSPSGYTPAANESNTRKRNFAETEEGSAAARSTADEQLMTQAQRASLEAAIDPLLSAAAGNPPASSVDNSSQAPNQKGKSKEELEAEVKRMRELLLAAEGELARLKSDEQGKVE